MYQMAGYLVSLNINRLITTGRHFKTLLCFIVTKNVALKIKQQKYFNKCNETSHNNKIYVMDKLVCY